MLNNFAVFCLEVLRDYPRAIELLQTAVDEAAAAPAQPDSTGGTGSSECSRLALVDLVKRNLSAAASQLLVFEVVVGRFNGGFLEQHGYEHLSDAEDDDEADCPDQPPRQEPSAVAAETSVTSNIDHEQMIFSPRARANARTRRGSADSAAGCCGRYCDSFIPTVQLGGFAAGEAESPAEEAYAWDELPTAFPSDQSEAERPAAAELTHEDIDKIIQDPTFNSAHHGDSYFAGYWRGAEAERRALAKWIMGVQEFRVSGLQWVRGVERVDYFQKDSPWGRCSTIT